jgi:hypothetical protein
MGVLLKRTCFSASGAEKTNAIPPLRPPQPEIPPGFWELYGTWIIWGGLLALALASLAVWRLTRPKPVVPIAPATRAKAALRELQAASESGMLLSQVSQIVRRYFAEALGFGPAELTTTEFCQALGSNGRLDPGLREETVAFLRACDQKKFSASPDVEPLNPVVCAVALIDRAEQALSVSADPGPGANESRATDSTNSAPNPARSGT